jgi:tetratricopeptide (TPR) repeat protein
MSDPKDKKLDLDGLDWDSALAEWEEKSFVPEVAKDKETDGPGVLQGTPIPPPIASRPLYVPEAPPPNAPRTQTSAPKPSASSRPLGSSHPSSPDALRGSIPVEEGEEEAGATVVARIPRELLRHGADGGAPRSSGGGLGQMFARVERPSGEHAAPERPSVAARAPQAPPDEAVYTSAQELRLRSPPAPAVDAPRRSRTPPPPDPHAGAPEGAMFDPFSEPDPFGQLARSGGAGVQPARVEPPSPPSVSVVEETTDVFDDDDFASSVQPTRPPPPPVEAAHTDGAEASGPSLHRPKMRSFDPDTDTSSHLRGAIHSPSRREYDPNEETSVLSKAALRRIDEPEDEAGEDPTRFQVRGDRAPMQRQTQSWENERRAQDLLPDALRTSFGLRAEWLESEARATEDRSTRARALLAASELRAMTGDTESAEILAREAAATSPTLALAPKQARALAPVPRESGPMAEALDAEGRQAPTHAGRVHDALLAADVLRLAGDSEGAAKRWDQAVRAIPSDPRAPLSRAADCLARRALSHAALRVPDAPELQPIGEAIARALKIRGVAHPNVGTDEKLPNDALRRAREALAMGEMGNAAVAIAEIARVPELRDAASWLAAALGSVDASARSESADWLRILSARSPAARRALAARALELGAGEVVEEAVRSGDGFSAADRAVLAFLSGVPHASSDEDLDDTAASPELRPLAAALAAVGAPKKRAERTAGTGRARDAVRLARLIAADAPIEAVEDALAPFDGDHDGETRAMALEIASRSGRFGEVSDAIAGWSDDDEDGARDRSLAAAFVAERAGDVSRAVAAYTSARAFDPANEAALRALGALNPRSDLAAELRSLGDARGEGPAAATAWLEAVARGGNEQDEELRGGLLEAAHRAAPEMPIAGFLAERGARRLGDVDAVLRWIRERRTATASKADPVQSALDDVVEALLVADKDPAEATERLASAHRARPDDVALRELHERVALDPPADRAAWREARAKRAATPGTRSRLLLEAAHEHERTGDAAAAMRAASAANAEMQGGLARLALERAEIDSGAAARLADSLLGVARSTEDPRARREAYERLADLDATGRGDQASALLWHKTILEEDPLYLPSLRTVEHALLSDGRIDELEPVANAITRALVASGDTSGEAGAHAQLSARLRMRGAAGDWAATQAITELAASFAEPSLWSLRAAFAHARSSNDEPAVIRLALALAERTKRAPEIGALVLRAGEAAMRAEDLPKARELLERAIKEDPGDVVTWGLLAEVRQQSGDAAGAAEACEGLARTSVVDEHRLLAWYDAGVLWLDEVRDQERGVRALAQAAAIDLTFQDLFTRLSALYGERGQRAELARLLEKRLETGGEDVDRAGLEVERARALLAAGDDDGARRALESALQTKPDDVAALGTLADLCAKGKDWEAAERAWVRLARLVPDAEDQRAVYSRLGELYSEHNVNLARAEVAIKEVLKRAPGDVPTLERLLGVYQRQNDGTHALEIAQELLKAATDPAERRRRLADLALVHENTTRDLRKAEQALETARREFPSDVSALRALAEFYQRQRQMPAVNILLDRASGDARRSLAAGRFSPVLFEVLDTVHQLRGKRDAARVAEAMLGALEGRGVELPGAGGKAGDPRLDDLLAPEALTPSLRAMLVRAGDALDVVSALDLKALHAQPLTSGAAQAKIASLASSLGVPPVQVLLSPQLGRTCVPSTSNPPCVVIGEPLAAVINEPAAAFVVVRALKLVLALASALVRTSPPELALLVAAWLQLHNAAWTPQGVSASALGEAKRRIQAALPKKLDSELGTIALEVAGTLGPHLATLGSSTITWADRVALLYVGNPNAALDGIAWSVGMTGGAPKEAEQRTAWVVHTGEVRDLLVFAVSDGFAEARAKAGFSA